MSLSMKSSVGRSSLPTPPVLAYRESHGGEVRNEAWRRQFSGRESLDRDGLHVDRSTLCDLFDLYAVVVERLRLAGDAFCFSN